MTDRSPLFSVAMPTRNQADFLELAVESVLGQGLADVELVVVDGASSDGTPSRLASLALRHPGRLRWSSAPDSGPANAVNRAVAQARGSILGWLNSDDVFCAEALRRVADHFARHADHVAVYGHGEHVDLFGRSLGRYPTLPPETPIAQFREGCFVCQPTMFVRREAWLALGGLDESLGAAFDFELWLRAFKAFEGRIGFIDENLAQSRLHSGGITLGQRERVAFEGMAVLRRHLGEAPPQWLLTLLAERSAAHPFAGRAERLDAVLATLLERAAPLLEASSRDEVRARIDADRAVQLATASLFIAVEPDGWALDSAQVRWRHGAVPARALMLRCRHARPGGGALEIHVQSTRGDSRVHRIAGNGEFSLELPLNDPRADAREVFALTSPTPFIPAEVEPGSTDQRRLAFQVIGCDVLLR